MVTNIMQPFLKPRNLDPKAMKPLVKLHNLSSHHTTSLYITQLKSRDFCPYVSQTSFKSCKEQPPDNLSKSDANSLSPAL